MCVLMCVPMCIHSHVCIFTPYAGAHLCVSMCVHPRAVCRHPPHYSQLPAFFFFMQIWGIELRFPWFPRQAFYQRGWFPRPRLLLSHSLLSHYFRMLNRLYVWTHSTGQYVRTIRLHTWSPPHSRKHQSITSNCYAFCTLWVSGVWASAGNSWTNGQVSAELLLLLLLKQILNL